MNVYEERVSSVPSVPSHHRLTSPPLLQALKAVLASLFASPLSLTPQTLSPTSLLVPVPKPTWEKRKVLVKDASALCESARVRIRGVRGKGGRELKEFEKEEGKREGKKVS